MKNTDHRCMVLLLLAVASLALVLVVAGCGGAGAKNRVTVEVTQDGGDVGGAVTRIRDGTGCMRLAHTPDPPTHRPETIDPGRQRRARE